MSQSRDFRMGVASKSATKPQRNSASKQLRGFWILRRSREIQQGRTKQHTGNPEGFFAEEQFRHGTSATGK
jgi:hypothetical protein